MPWRSRCKHQSYADSWEDLSLSGLPQMHEIELAGPFLSLQQSFHGFSSDIVCPKRGGFAVVQNEEIELIPNSIGTGWRVYVGNLSRHKYKKSSLDDFTCLWNSFENCLSRLEKMLQRCEGHNLCLNWEKSLFMSKRALTSAIKFLNLGLRLEKPK
ncbi:hypothetical protein Tco_0907060 [Tanacetum coccineum]|uniref:Uncharacterized protein n=1 Tax=Tanacetum coccineum TaxID=301880 RepID=A0ABQ5CID3_9ASTR